MTLIEIEADLDRAASDVFALVADAENKLLGHATNPPRPGMPLALQLRTGTQTLPLTGKVLAVEPGRRLAAHYTGPGVEGDISYHFEPLPFATRLRLVADWHLTARGGIAQWLANRALRAEAQATLERIRRLAQAKS